MSEYQYYEFLAIDRPLSEAARAALRDVSSRARISSTSFANSYDWGDLKADPLQLLERHFDLFLYLANWGTRRFAMRLPRRLIDPVDLMDFHLDTDLVRVETRGEHVVVDIDRGEVEDDDWGDGSGWLASLVPLRAQVLAGDRRLFSLLWLIQVENGWTAEDEAMPAPGIAPLSGPLTALAEFLGLGGDLLEAAVAAGPALPTAGHLRRAAEHICEERRQAEQARTAAEHRRRAEEQAAARARHLASLAKRGQAAWTEVEALIEQRNAGGYDKAAALLADLGEIAAQEGRRAEFLRRLAAIRDRHARKGRFIDRLDAASLTADAG